MSSDEDDNLNNAMFQEPDDYFQPEEPYTHTDYTLLSGQKLRLRLVGHNPLWGHYLWNGSQVLSTYLQQHAPTLAHGKTILELGAGAGLPSLVAAILGAQKVVVTDYPDAELIDNLAQNIATCSLLPQPATTVAAEGYLWGSSTESVLAHLPLSHQRFDVLLLADLLFNHSCHNALVSTIVHTLARTADARALVFFTPYRPWLLEKDMAFFDLCRDKGLEVDKVVEEVMEKVMFEKDEGDELLRRTVFGYEVRWKDLIETRP
ncbi:hypothetical protein HO133_002133 [Letharia lupina]|uniref:Protein N-terminal and lysine N-methyltransferase EFM7 n=1 Tax=Letharia lupina TaxID=560253 RepID=A0A8H6CCZ6_9LECA|nr:uncharacterized protein HO133_002133 [Letharia lupina]KAF6221278.1 hypothetical protein HO133_002133 [Letharia lupina]